MERNNRHNQTIKQGYSLVDLDKQQELDFCSTVKFNDEYDIAKPCGCYDG
ncbi:MAG: hypothetical protein HQK95_09725 [Nitrospirae bacterium]|nr:hypothetical protein [Nitrospirota bacterium]